MSKYRVELTKENQSGLQRAANADGRSLVKQTNYVVAEYLEARAAAESAQKAMAILAVR